MPHLSFDQMSCTALKGVGTHVAGRLQKLGIITVQDLLFHLPYRYQDRTHISPMGSIRPGDYVVVEGTIELAQIHQGKKRSLLCYIADGTGHLILRFFYFNRQQFLMLSQKGTRIRCFGEVRLVKTGLELIHPEYRLINPEYPVFVEENLTPLYSTTEGMSQTMWRKLTDQALILLKENSQLLLEYFPLKILEQFKLSNLQEALHYVHRPPADASLKLLMSGNHFSQRRLAIEELLAQQLSLQRLRVEIQKQQAPIMNLPGSLLQPFISRLPFTLTAAQQRVIQEVIQDLSQTKPMMRLVQGDVGSGKTMVAAAAALYSIGNNYQAALMAPTELLAEQHFQNFHRWFTPFNLNVVFLSSKQKPKEKENILQQIREGKANLMIGTHALFQETVEFQNLGLIIIDEQHRFGVHQRLALREKGIKNNLYPHQLIMTATPIPRTLAMTAYADLDSSIIDELPPGRTPVITVVIANQRRAEVINRVKESCQQGKQVYWVCTLIDESELLQCEAAEKTTAQLQVLLPQLRVALIHGRLKSSEKEEIMCAFKNKQIDLLVATTVIEVGVDVPNASLMIIENAERLGLAQLHQLRGRVGRGAVQSHCVLLYQAPLSYQAKQRLNIMRQTCDGFEIAQKDLEMRGPGEVLGTQQTGLLQFKIADLLRDKELLPLVQKLSHVLLQFHPDCIDLFIQRWVGNKKDYSNA